jgi:transcriptional regulator with GAF, ATPase, and Fis domain
VLGIERRKPIKVWLTPDPVFPREGIAELKQRERKNLTAALAQTSGKVFGPDGAAALLGIKPTTLVSRLKALGLTRKVGPG